MTFEPGAQPARSTPDGGRIARRPGTGQLVSVASMFPPEPATRSTGLVERLDGRRTQVALLAAALVLALVASLGVALVWSANRKLAGEVEVALAQAESAQAESAQLRAALEAGPDTETVDALAGRLESVEAWTGLPAEGTTGMADLQTRLLEVSNGIDSLESNLQDGLGTVRTDLASVRNDLRADQDATTDTDIDAVRQEIGDLRGAVDGIRQDVGVLCWALAYRTDVAASC
ncbi:hypothetical protein GCM10009718_21100 [Isoptericola halotolerans]|uniref:Uncharacterized protein n=1 Tax=Isoptericola halotolerans TaxID=300560 RepID=A0ABX2AAH1_9MICO|nr:hypothetical protein [Isoptericola halotolerans]NOV98956.1 hypothetical protein [Isoptericola halotolerans]